MKEGDTVKVNYVGSYDDGHVFDSTEVKGPLSFIIGEKKVMPAFENVVKDMKIGEKRKIRIEPKDAYGERRKELVQEVPRSVVEKKAQIKMGTIIGLNLPGTKKMYPATIVGFNEKTVTLDLNQPMAGKYVNFEIELVEVIDYLPKN